MNSKQFAWLYLIKNGDAGVRYSYYGGFILDDERMTHLYKPYDHKSLENIKSAYLKEIRDIGVNWTKTGPPSSDIVHLFNGTFNPSEYSEKISGVIVLNNGLRQSWVADNIDVSNVFNMMESLFNSAEDAKTIFGDHI